MGSGSGGGGMGGDGGGTREGEKQCCESPETTGTGTRRHTAAPARGGGEHGGAPKRDGAGGWRGGWGKGVYGHCPTPQWGVRPLPHPHPLLPPPPQPPPRLAVPGAGGLTWRPPRCSTPGPRCPQTALRPSPCGAHSTAGTPRRQPPGTPTWDTPTPPPPPRGGTSPLRDPAVPLGTSLADPIWGHPPRGSHWGHPPGTPPPLGTPPGDTLHSQVEHEVVEALLRDAVVEPHCRDRDRLRGQQVAPSTPCMSPSGWHPECPPAEPSKPSVSPQCPHSVPMALRCPYMSPSTSSGGSPHASPSATRCHLPPSQLSPGATWCP